jgi:F-type H+-transporting ATPase subunit b
VITTIRNVLLLAQEAEEEGSDVADLIPHVEELIWGTIAFAVLFFFMAKWVFPRLNQTLEARRERIQGELEKAEQTRREADQILTEYRQQLADSRDEANRIIEEARNTAESMRREMLARAEQENQAVLARAQEEIRAERDRVFQELKSQVGELSLALAGKVVGESLDRDRHLRLVDDYIEELSSMPAGGGNGHRAGPGGNAAGLPPAERRQGPFDSAGSEE